MLVARGMRTHLGCRKPKEMKTTIEQLQCHNVLLVLKYSLHITTDWLNINLPDMKWALRIQPFSIWFGFSHLLWQLSTKGVCDKHEKECDPLNGFVILASHRSTWRDYHSLLFAIVICSQNPVTLLWHICSFTYSYSNFKTVLTHKQNW